MARSLLCVSCASLPLKAPDAAVKRQRCPDCDATIGLTAYGGQFRLLPAKQRILLAPSFLQGMAIGSAIFMFVVMMLCTQLWIDGQARPSVFQEPTQASIPDELVRVPEVSLEDPQSQRIRSGEGKQHVLSLIARIRGENAVKQDGFLLAHMDRRRELRGLPFVMGDDCRLPMDRARSFQEAVTAVREAVDVATSMRSYRADDTHVTFWNAYSGRADNRGLDEMRPQSGMAALAQILGPQSMNLRASFAQHLGQWNTPEATKMLAKAAIFDPSGDVRNIAIKSLKERPREQYTDVLLSGLRYPMAAVARRASVAMILLDRKDLLPSLVDFLGEAAPGDPVEATVNDRKACTVQEVVRINHHRNCLLCHAPAQTGNVEEVPGLIPSPGSPFPPTTREYYGSAFTRGEPVVRADTTYLRQDFSVMMPVENAAPWPDLQRFDFLVRTRVVEGNELAALQARVRQRAADFLSENHQAAVRVLRELTGQDAAPTQDAWRRVINP